MLTLFQPSKEIEVDKLEEILENIEKKKISENDVKTIMQKLSEGKSLKEASQKSDVNLKEEAQKIIKQKPDLSQGAYMGLLMGKFKGQLSGKEVANILKELL
jgi:Glu-tRNA(Gln) amidotransferase subunit E-like FAD-binding protein